MAAACLFVAVRSVHSFSAAAPLIDGRPSGGGGMLHNPLPMHILPPPSHAYCLKRLQPYSNLEVASRPLDGGGLQPQWEVASQPLSFKGGCYATSLLCLNCPEKGNHLALLSGHAVGPLHSFSAVAPLRGGSQRSQVGGGVLHNPCLCISCPLQVFRTV